VLISRSIGIRSPIDPSPRRLSAGDVETGAFPRVHNPSAHRLVRNDRHPTNTRAVTGPHEAVARRHSRREESDLLLIRQTSPQTAETS